MPFNYRVVRRKHETYRDEVTYAVHEAYYEDDDRVSYITEEPSFPIGESLEELSEELERMRAAFQKPVLDYDTLVPIEAEEETRA